MVKHFDYKRYCFLETVLFNEVNTAFHKNGFLTAEEFFMIIIWKANRAKSKVAKKILSKGYKSLQNAVKSLTQDIAKKETNKEKLRLLLKDWDLRLPMTTAILSVLYPDDFTIYDIRVCDMLDDFHCLNNLSKFENVWPKYLEFKERVAAVVPEENNLRDKDRYLWGKSFYEQLKRDIENNYKKAKE